MLGVQSTALRAGQAASTIPHSHHPFAACFAHVFAVKPSVKLSDQGASTLGAEIRTVVREAISRLKSLGLDTPAAAVAVLEELQETPACGCCASPAPRRCQSPN